MRGEECSIIAATDGENIQYLLPSQDHKALLDNDEGPMTGGMGAYAPAPVVTPDVFARIHSEVMVQTVRALALENRPYKGFLYAGLMITSAGPKVVEFNCRLGDPEAQVILPLMRTDLVQVMWQIAAKGKLRTPIENYAEKWAMCVVVATEGYPGDYKRNLNNQIFGLGNRDIVKQGIEVFHAGTKTNQAGAHVFNSGGRVLGVTATGDDFGEVRNKAYWAVGNITFDGAYYRRDIGAKALRHLK